METKDFKIGAKVEHPQFGTGIITNVTLTSYTIYFGTKGEKSIAAGFQGLKLLETFKFT